MHFIDLAVLIEGGEEGVVASLERDGTTLSLCTPPCCFFGIFGCTKPATMYEKINHPSNYKDVNKIPVFENV